MNCTWIMNRTRPTWPALFSLRSMWLDIDTTITSVASGYYMRNFTDPLDIKIAHFLYKRFLYKRFLRYSLLWLQCATAQYIQYSHRPSFLTCSPARCSTSVSLKRRTCTGPAHFLTPEMCRWYAGPPERSARWNS